ncbi:E3 ubiquitin/ISG15 ligase TRIM25-like, partial [Tachysurus ichikawai]
MVESHKGHKSSSVEIERIKNQDALEKKKIECLRMIAQREQGLRALSKAVTSVKCFAQAAEEDNERILAELIDSMKTGCSAVNKLIRAQEKPELRRAEALRQHLDRELKELRARIPEIQQILSTNDHVTFIRKCTSDCGMPMFKDLPKITCVSRDTSGILSISGVKKHIEDVCEQEVARISKQVMHIYVVEPSEPVTREDFLQYFCDLHVDPNTINDSLRLSEGDKKVAQSPPAQQYPDHPERFDFFANFLCKEGLYGRCYWEADCSGNSWSVAVSYKSIMRKGGSNECRFGYNSKSWRLYRSNQQYYFSHKQIEVSLHQFNSKTIGVYVSHSGGTLSFYSVSDKMILLHKVHTMFAEPLYAGFGVGPRSVVRILEKC